MSDNIPPLLFHWSGEAMVPYYPSQADRHYVVGERYRLVVHEDRSQRSHNHYHAAVGEAFDNLPEALAERFPTVEHLRKYALIKCGYYDHTSLVSSSPEEAQKIAAFMQTFDEYAIIVVRDCVVDRYVAKSQSYRAMGKKDFGESKQKVLDFLSRLIGVERENLEQNAGGAA